MKVMECFYKTKKLSIKNNDGKKFVYEFELRDKSLPQNQSIYVFGNYGVGEIADKLYRKYPKVKYIGFDDCYTLREDFI